MLDPKQVHRKNEDSENLFPVPVSLFLAGFISTCRFLLQTILQLFVIPHRQKPFLGIDQATKYQEVVAIVENLKKLQQKVRVKIIGDTGIYTSTITAVNPEYGMMVIENFRPGIESSLTFGRIMDIEVESQGKKIGLRCHFIDALVPNINLGYQLKLPLMIL